MKYLALRNKGKHGRLKRIIKLEDEQSYPEVSEGQTVKEFIPEEIDDILRWGRINTKIFVQGIMKKNKISKTIISMVENDIKNTVIKEAITYLINNPRIKIIRDYDNEFRRSKNSSALVREFDNAIILKRGPLNPLEFKTFMDFLQEPTENVKTNFFISEKVEKILCVCDVISEKITTSITYYDVLENIKNITWNSNEYKSLVIPDELLVISELQRRIESEIKKEISFSIQNILIGREGTLVNEDFFEIYIKGCNLLGIEPEYQKEFYESINESMEEKAYKSLTKLKDIRKLLALKDNPAQSHDLRDSQESIQRQIKKLVQANVIKSERTRNKFRERVIAVITEATRLNSQADKRNIEIRLNIEPLLKKICMIEINEYLDKQILINLSDLLSTNECIRDFLNNGIEYVSKYSYIKLETKASIKELIPASPELEYPMARDIKRHFIIHYGPTNSGKTHDALEKLMEAETGTYLGPLRLLALEVQDKLNDSGVPCSLLTGEEEEIIDNAGHISSTVEKADMFNQFDVCVIDECQMISDEYRGFAWTRAILGIQAKTIYLCMGPEAVDLCIELIKMCGDTYELVEHKRRSELVVEQSLRDFSLSKKDIEEGDAIIVFSKKKVLQVSAELISKGIKTSIIYGNLPYSVRKKQVARFLNHETDVVVSTDAIGMGINLPVRRIIFLENEKFNGKSVEPLTVSQVKQIAGRAGRNTETGYVNSTKGTYMIKNKLSEPTPKVKKAFLGFSDEIISINAELSDILKVWKSIPTNKLFNRMDISRLIHMDQMVYVDVSKKDKLKMINIPFDEKNEYLLEIWIDYCQLYATGKELYIPKCMGKDLYHLEDYYKALDLYYSFSRNFGYVIDMKWLKIEKESVSDRINAALINDLSKHQRRCRTCGKPLKWDHPFAICEECYYSDFHY